MRSVILLITIISCTLADRPDLISPTYPSPIKFQLFQHNTGYRHKFASTAQEVLDAETAGFLNYTTATPMRGFGAPGVALFDFDQDGDVDIYVTNTAGRANSLLSNQLMETGEFGFIDVGVAAGVGLFNHDSLGVCYGDIDNDGDQELFVMGQQMPWRLLDNNGDGTFTEMTPAANYNPSGMTANSCSLGDIDNDGFLDLYVPRTIDPASSESIFAINVGPHDLNYPNTLYRNRGPNTFPRFADITAASGITLNRPNITWSAALVDMDFDGDIDIRNANDQAACPPFLGIRGLVQTYKNDGTGRFVDITQDTSLGYSPVGAHMGFAFADWNCDSRMDFYSSNFGDFFAVFLGSQVFNSYTVGERSSDIYYGAAGYNFTKPGTGPFLGATVFSWGNSAMDFDNDGDQDLVATGAIHQTAQVELSPGTTWENTGSCSGIFRRVDAFALGAYNRRGIAGSASADLNNDGWPDYVSVSDFDLPQDTPLIKYETLLEQNNATAQWRSPYVADYITYLPFGGPGRILFDKWGGQFTGRREQEGRLYIEINDGATNIRSRNNNWVQVSLQGCKGITPNGKVNRDGIGATFFFTPKNGKTVILPNDGGISHASQHSLVRTFGLGRANRGTLTILWPGGVWNRIVLYDGDVEVVPEIPCSFRAFPGNFRAFQQCLVRELRALRRAGVITPAQKGRLEADNEKAWRDYHNARAQNDDDDDDRRGNRHHWD